MNQEMLSAIQDGRMWLDQFQYRSYPKAFAQYQVQYGPAYRKAISRCGGEEELKALAEELLDAMEAGWKKARFWNRSSMQVDQKQVIITYLSPMLLEMEEPACQRFAALLQECWAARWPKNTYRIATYKKLCKGFHNCILGIDLGSFEKDSEEAD